MATNKLTDAAIRRLPPGAKRYSDGGGLFLQVDANGVRRWIFRIYTGGKETMTSFGTYPEVTLAEARGRAEEGRKLKRQGVNPVEHKRDEKAKQLAETVTFQQVAEMLLDAKKSRCTERYIAESARMFERHAYPTFGSRAIGGIAPREVIALAQSTEKAGRYLAHRVTARMAEIFEYAISLGFLQHNPVNRATHKSVKPHERKNMAAIGYDELPDMLARFDEYRGFKITKLAFRFLMLTFVRTGEMRQLRWQWVDIENRQIVIPASAMKARRDHTIPLSDQSVSILNEAHKLTGKFQLVFPTPSDFSKPLSENAILDVLKRIGYGGKMTGHGFRSLARSKLAEEGFSRDALELQLAHSVSKDATEAAYNRATHMDERRRMMQRWADLVDDCHLRT